MALLRSLLLAAASNRSLKDRAMAAGFVRRSVSRFMPGEHLDAAMGAASELQKMGIGTMLTGSART